jgi:hypothetical protein
MERVPGTVVAVQLGLIYNKFKDLLIANSRAVVGTTHDRNVLEPGCDRSRTSRRSLGRAKTGAGLGAVGFSDPSGTTTCGSAGRCGNGDGVGAPETLDVCGMNTSDGNGVVAGGRGIDGPLRIVMKTSTLGTIETSRRRFLVVGATKY